jgi:hypothetical protein
MFRLSKTKGQALENVQQDATINNYNLDDQDGKKYIFIFLRLNVYYAIPSIYNFRIASIFLYILLIDV